MVDSAKHNKLLRGDGKLVETFAEIGVEWKEYIKIHNVDKNQNWSQHLELDYMSINNIQYTNASLTTQKP